jgi:hypothetical protein
MKNKLDSIWVEMQDDPEYELNLNVCDRELWLRANKYKSPVNRYTAQEVRAKFRKTLEIQQFEINLRMIGFDKLPNGNQSKDDIEYVCLFDLYFNKPEPNQSKLLNYMCGMAGVNNGLYYGCNAVTEEVKIVTIKFNESEFNAKRSIIESETMPSCDCCPSPTSIKPHCHNCTSYNNGCDIGSGKEVCQSHSFYPEVITSVFMWEVEEMHMDDRAVSYIKTNGESIRNGKGGMASAQLFE